LAQAVLRKRKVEIAEGKFLEKQRPVITTLDELADAYLKWIRPNQRQAFQPVSAPGRAMICMPLDGFAPTSAASA
jgi:hypothetical protein